MKQIRTVLVEDDLSTCALMKELFQTQQRVDLCALANDGEEGLALIRSLEPDLVLLDLVMPRRSGVGVIDALQKQPLSKPPKIIVLSQVSNEETIRSILDKHVSYYFIKPVNFPELIRVIYMLFEERQGAQMQAELAWRYLLEMGAEVSELGFRYAATTAETLAAYTGRQKMLLKEAYHPIIKEDHTNYSCVEKNIRATVRRIHMAGTETYHRLMGGPPGAPPTNGTFLRRLALQIQEERKSGAETG